MVCSYVKINAIYVPVLFTVHTQHIFTYCMRSKAKRVCRVERKKEETNIKRSFRLPHVKRLTIIHVIIMLILCWHWNSFPFTQKLLHNIRLRKLNFYSSNFSTVIFLMRLPYKYTAATLDDTMPYICMPCRTIPQFIECYNTSFFLHLC